ncbi:ComEA family DNA-binding protein [Pedobacter sp. MR2016-24]|uniref:ComEA family DNA-binding protein n=1 Tax=Pedobacter sp. MR2016-24 TaxID=2994466 RepID=UPI0022463BB2|nr:helix-hairpin-helix domain-containing protein [Pedobacter sp. MR2016-24]MCX2483925.1 helix-hairpin-helix domain-containing protein [Pedobacter sp. MR2016-24]
MRGEIMLLIPLLLMTVHPLHAQEEEAAKAIIEDFSDAQPEERDLTEIIEKLASYKKNPLDLNNASAEQLKEINLLSMLQINNLMNHIKVNGKLLDLLELQSIPGFDGVAVEKIMPFFTVNTTSGPEQLNLKNIREKGNSILIWRYAQLLEKQKGYTDLPGSRYMGGPEKLLMKYRYTFSNTASAALLMKKDAGESLFGGAGKSGFDFISGHIALHEIGAIKTLLVGDYSLQFGQGLTLWTGLSFGRGADVAGAAKKDTGLKPYTSSSEYAFFRGVASKIKIFKIIDLTTFISLRKLDGTLTADDKGHQTVSTINVGGLHRTPAEIRNKGSVSQYFYGSVLQLDRSNFSAGLIATHSIYQHQFTTGSQLYNRFGFSGTRLTNLGMHYNYTFRNTYVFGETSMSLPGGIATLTGMMTSLSSRLSAVILYRNYAKDHINFYAQAPGKNSDGNNEKGFYAGININLSRAWNVSVYLDSYHHPWLMYRVDAASHGNELSGQLSYSPKKTLKLQLRLKTTLSEQNTMAELPFNALEDVYKGNYRIDMSGQLNRKISLQSRIEVSRYHKSPAAKEYGILIYQDMEYKVMSAALSANLRLAWFSTPSYNARIYAYEDDVLYASGSGLYSGKGFRTYLNLKYRLTRQLYLWSKIAVYYYPGQLTTGSGLDEISGNKKSEIKLQLRYQF